MQNFIERQHMFFVATTPGDGGSINLSPKGSDDFGVLVLPRPHRISRSLGTGHPFRY